MSIFNKLQSELSESIFDDPQKTLSPQIFNGTTLKSEVRKEILNRLYAWDDLEKSDIKDIYMIGSTTTYQYNDASDIDINVILKLSTAKIDPLWDKRPNEKVLSGTKHPVNYFLANDTKGVDKSVALYDVLANKWIRKPQKNKTEIPFDYVSEIAQFFIDGIDLRISDYEKEFRSYEYYKTKKSTFSSTEWDDMIRDKERDIDSALDAIYVGWHMLHAFRSEGFEDEVKTFIIQVQSTDPNYSINNLVYKELEKIGYFEKVKPYIDIRKKRLVQ